MIKSINAKVFLQNAEDVRFFYIDKVDIFI